MGREIFRVTTLLALLMVARSEYCREDEYGIFRGQEHVRDATVPANVTEYDVPIPMVCRKFDYMTGLTAHGCNDYDWTLKIMSKKTIHVHRDESPDEINVRIEIWCVGDGDN